MNLLLDANLSHRLLAMLLNDFPQSVHVREIGLTRASDDEIWRYSRPAGFSLCRIFHLRASIFQLWRLIPYGI
ncbi:MAG: DUF5615 family PIN-like protein [Stellaceae bacterium]